MTGRYYESTGTDAPQPKAVQAPSGKVSIGLAVGPKIPCILEIIDEAHWRVVPAEQVNPDDFASMTIDGIPDGVKLIYEYEGRVVDIN